MEALLEIIAVLQIFDPFEGGIFAAGDFLGVGNHLKPAGFSN